MDDKAEIAFCDLETCITTTEELVKHVVRHLLETSEEELQYFNKMVDPSLLERLKKDLETPFERISYADAISLLQREGSKHRSIQYGQDLSREHEEFLCDKYFQKPVFVLDWPKDLKAFYMRTNDDGKTVAAMDLLVPTVGELVGGSAREERYTVLKENMERLGMDLQEYGWYLDLRKYGTVPHAGFGLGIERLIRYVTGTKHIKDTIPLPRTRGHCYF